jgi:hypothetical protein
MRRTFAAICFACSITALAAVAFAPATHAATIAYWRMEVDNDVTASGLSVPNELAFGTSLISAEAELDSANLPTTIVPLSDDPNAFSIAATQQGGANGINASAAWYTELAATSISIEFWARTQESNATPFQWTTGGSDGITLADPNSLDLTYWVDVGGAATSFQLLALDNMDTNWSHYAFTYEEISGLARFYLDGTLISSFDGPDNSPLVIIPGTPIELGVLMDYASAGQGTMDEVKIDNRPISPAAFLIPEPSTGLLLGFALMAAGRRRHA